MRMLIYGGTEHNIRSRIGTWDVVSGVMSDLYGIPSSGWMVGFGILPEGSFLFLKTTQKGAGQRPYAYTILLDPAENVWEKFGWNAAAFAISLLTKNPFAEQLLNNPESFDEKKLAQMVESLPLIDIVPKGGKLGDLIAGSIYLEKPVVVNPHSLDFEFLRLEEFAAQIEALPPFLRTGKGWLFGGSLENAKYLGAKVVFDENAVNSNQKEIEQIESEGSVLSGNLKEFSKVPEAARALDEFRKIPIWQWKAKFGIEPSEFIQRVEELYKLKNIEIIDDYLAAKDKETKIGGILGSEIRTAFLRSILQSNGNFSAKKTEFILQKVGENEISVKDLPLDLLDPNVYNEWLIKHGKLPSEFGASARLDLQHIRRNCREQIANEKIPSQIPPTLQKAGGELEKAGGQEFCQELANEAFAKTKHNWESIWLNYRAESFFKKYLAGYLAKIARDAVKSKENWQIGYLSYADDLGGHWLNSEINKLKVSEFVGILLKYYRQKDADTETPTEWLAALAMSPLRNKLTNNEKLEIVKINDRVTAAWKNFITLSAVLQGEKATQTASPEELIYLRGELQEFLNRTRDFKPNAKIEQSLKKLFGELPQEYLNFKDSGAAAVEEKKSADKKDSAENKKTASPKNSTLDFAPLKNTADEVVKGQEKLAQTVFEILKDKELQAALAADFWDKKDFSLKEIFPLLPVHLRAEILQLLSKNDSGRFVREINNLYEFHQFDPFSLSIWECFLLTGKGEILRRKVNKPVAKLTEFFSQASDLNVWKIPDSITEEVEITEKETEKPGIFSRLFGK